MSRFSIISPEPLTPAEPLRLSEGQLPAVPALGKNDEANQTVFAPIHEEQSVGELSPSFSGQANQTQMPRKKRTTVHFSQRKPSNSLPASKLGMVSPKLLMRTPLLEVTDDLRP